MKKQRGIVSNRLYWFVIVLGVFIFASCGQSDSEITGEGVIANASGIEGAVVETNISGDMSDYETVMAVLTHPRCSNCHPVDHAPRQRDSQIEHLFNVERGEDNHGGPVQTCETCHHEENNPASNVPGAPHWGLAPHSMGWLGLPEAEIAATLLDPAKNGDRSFEDLLKHMSEDALVLWAWDPGDGRTPIPIPHDQFVAALDSWLAAGAPIPTAAD